MTPALLKILQAAGQTATAGLGAVPYLIPNAAEQANRAEMERLQKAKDAGLLGLTGDQRENLYTGLNVPLEKQLASSEAMLRQLGGVSATSGQASRQGAALASEAAKAQLAINNQVERADADAQEAQKAELAARQQADAQAKQNRVAAVLAAPTALLDFLMGSSAVDATVFGTKTKDQSLSEIKESLIAQGFPEDKATTIAQSMIDDPALMKSANESLFGKK